MSEPIETIDAFSLPPDGGGTVKAFSRIGYDLVDALADLIDNSLDADASRVEITFHRDDEQILSVTLADNGHGMAAADLRSAMRFATHVDRKEGALGVFGLGMKSASLSQCRSLTVLSRASSPVAGCRWTVESAKADWRCEVLDPAGGAKRFDGAYGGGKEGVPGPDAGTVVMWERLDRMAVHGGEEGLDDFLAQLMSSLDLRLGTIFHRFIARRFGIVLRTKHVGRRSSLPRRVGAHDPFGYPSTGRSGYPKTFEAELPGGDVLALHAHIWPVGSTSPDFLLGRRTATPHQGFYFYRHDRLIQAGGWNGVVKDASDPELALARLSVEIPPHLLDTNVQKSAIQTTASLSHALAAARSGDVAFSTYLTEARKAHRTGRRRPESGQSVPVVIGAGVPVGLQRAVDGLLAKKGPSRPIDFVWASLSKKKVFEVEAADDRIVLNRKYRRELLGGAPASGADAPLLKTLLFLLLEDELERSRMSQKRSDWLERCNRILLEYVRSA